jgi:uncharacterized protein (TIGR02600 family)
MTTRGTTAVDSPTPDTKIPMKKLIPNASPGRRDQGVALVVVLSCLLLVCGLVLSFFLSISTETKSSKLADSGGRGRDLVDTAVNVVMAQIRAATTGGANVAWASQPGMIRTYGNADGTPSANPKANYKLYSAREMTWVNGGTAFDPTADVVSTWSQTPALFTDLNQPVRDLQNQLQYPIVDPQVLDLNEEQRPQGFKISGAPLGSNQPPGVEPNPAPMPVRWLYVLSDGSLTSPTGGTPETTANGATATWDVGGANVPTKNNPIIGRVAFWTDDDTNKVNINTAAGDTWADAGAEVPGSFWDTPRTWSPLDVTFARRQLVNGEFQRYPGHPATVYLSAVFPQLTRQQIGAVVPRIKHEGSQGGTVQASFPITPDSDRLYASIDELVYAPDRSDQTGVDKGIEKAMLERSRFFLTAGSRAPETTIFNTPRVAVWPVSRDTSTDARSPYDSLIAFCSTIRDLPYYFTRDAATRNASIPKQHAHNPWLDYMGSVQPGSMDARVDASRNRELFAYLKTLTERGVPGFTSSTHFKGKYGEDRDQILTEIFDYIRSTNLFDDSLPNTTVATGKQFTGHRSNATTGTTAGHGMVAPIRIPSESAPGDRKLDNMGFGRFHTLSELGLAFICTADGSVDPATPTPNEYSPEGLKKKSNRTQNRTLAGITPGDAARGVPLFADERRIEAMLLLELFSPAQGWTGLIPDYRVQIRGLQQFSIGGVGETPKPLNFPATAEVRQTGGGGHDTRAWGGNNGIRYMLNGKYAPARGNMTADNGGSDGNRYPFISVPVTIKVNSDTDTMQFIGGTIEVDFYADASESPTVSNLVQTIVIDVPNGTFPVPRLVTQLADATNNYSTKSSYGADSSGTYYYNTPNTRPEFWWTFNRQGVFSTSTSLPDVSTSVDAVVDGTAGRLYTVGKGQGSNGDPRAGALFRREDVVRSLMPYHGDYRLIAASPYVHKDAGGKSIFQKHAAWDDPNVRLAHTFQVESSSNNHQRDFANNTASDPAAPWMNQPSGKLVAKAQYNTGRFPDGPHVFPYNAGTGRPTVPAGFNATQPETFGDWDNGLPSVADGAYINKPDEGNDFRNGGSGVPYYDVNWTMQSGGATLFSPNRQVPSPGMFGSLPTGVKAGVPWRTLLFRPDLSASSPTQPGNHPGGQAGYPKDHLIMDLFWMPVVEPYAISEPFSTAGKINMNYQMMPFTYIERTTALRALLRSERVSAIPFANASTYKFLSSSNAKMPETRLPVNLDGTLLQFKQRFAKGEIFKSASELAELHIVPKSVNISQNADAEDIFLQMRSFWNNHRLTGDNLKERPYTTLYSRLTTKSNTYTVHYRVQALRQVSRSRGDDAAAWATWDERRDNQLSETRGSTTIERYIDPLDPNLPDFARNMTASSVESLDNFYRFRVTNTKRFAP